MLLTAAVLPEPRRPGPVLLVSVVEPNRGTPMADQRHRGSQFQPKLVTGTFSKEAWQALEKVHLDTVRRLQRALKSTQMKEAVLQRQSW
jgi:hypothetical protein